MSKGLDMHRKTLQTSIVGSLLKYKFISRTIDNNCKIHESPGRKPDWDFAKKVCFNGNDYKVI